MKQRGDEGEAQACRHLEAAGLRLITRNYRCRQGEIDLIMRHDDTLVFVEVRLRSDPRFGSGAESIGPCKRNRLIKAAQHYLASQKRPPPCRFDVVALDACGAPEWIINAFDAY